MLSLQILIFSSILLIVMQGLYYKLTQKLFIEKINEIRGSKWNGFQSKRTIIGAILAAISAIFGLNYFIIQNKLPVTDSFLFGLVMDAFFSGICYATFDAFSAVGATLDTLWISSLMAFTTYITYYFFDF